MILFALPSCEPFLHCIIMSVFTLYYHVCFLLLPGTKALEDAGITYDQIEQAACGYVYGRCFNNVKMIVQYRSCMLLFREIYHSTKFNPTMHVVFLLFNYNTLRNTQTIIMEDWYKVCNRYRLRYFIFGSDF